MNAPERRPVTDDQMAVLIKDLNGTEPALSNFLKSSLSVRKLYTGYYLSNAKEDVKAAHLKKIIVNLNANKKPMF
jgi:hypothetical protein